jgi:acetyl-CoA C-acetyltransferase
VQDCGFDHRLITPAIRQNGLVGTNSIGQYCIVLLLEKAQSKMIAVSGVALTTYGRRKDGSSFRDWAALVFADALTMAELDTGDIDTLVVASESDFFTLQLNPASVIADDLGLAGVLAFRVEGGGASGQLAIHAGVARLMAGLARHVAVIGVDPSASGLPGDQAKDLYGFSFDAWTDGMTGASATMLYALSCQDFMARTGGTIDDLNYVTIKNRLNACDNPVAHLPRRHEKADIAASPMIASPYRRLHCSPLSDGAAAVILSRVDALPASRRLAPRITGIGAASDRTNLGARTNAGDFAAKRLAMQRACEMAGINAAQIDVAEVYDAYGGAELQAIAALGLSDQWQADLQNGVFHRDGRMPVNLSGGLMGQGAPAGAIGVGQTATCALLLEGRYHAGLQPARPLTYAVADTHGGICSTAAVTILSAAGAA